MTSRLAISFSAVIVLATQPAFGATVTGVISLVQKGDGTHDRDRSGVVVWLEPLSSSPVTSPVRERILQKDKAFSPHILAVPVGSTVDFPNLDPIYHNAFSNFNGQIFDIGLYPPGKSKSVVFRKPGIVRVFCNIHPTMSAVIVVVDTPYFTVTDRSGRYTIANVPEGNYKRMLFYERATPETLNSLAVPVEIDSGETTLPAVAISETGFIPLPHANKYGRAYPRGAGEDSYSIPQ